MNEFTRLLDDPGLRLNRRHFFSRTSLGLGGAALASLLSGSGRPGGARCGDAAREREARPAGDRPGRRGESSGRITCRRGPSG